MEITLSLLIGYIVGGIFSLLQELVDGFSGWLAAQSEGRKRLMSFGVSAIASLIVFGLACWGSVLTSLFPDIALTCDEQGALTLIAILIGTVTGGQVTHLWAKRT